MANALVCPMVGDLRTATRIVILPETGSGRLGSGLLPDFAAALIADAAPCTSADNFRELLLGGRGRIALAFRDARISRSAVIAKLWHGFDGTLRLIRADGSARSILPTLSSPALLTIWRGAVLGEPAQEVIPPRS